MNTGPTADQGGECPGLEGAGGVEQHRRGRGKVGGVQIRNVFRFAL